MLYMLQGLVHAAQTTLALLGQHCIPGSLSPSVETQSPFWLFGSSSMKVGWILVLNVDVLKMCKVALILANPQLKLHTHTLSE